MPENTDRIVTCTAPVNIAVIKYWGKSDEELIIPLNDSISFTLSQDEMCAKTTVMISPKFTKDRFWLNNKEEDISNPRLQNCLQEVRRRVSKRKHGEEESNLSKWNVHIFSVNNFPTAAGLASSAAGYACLAFTLGQVYGVEGNLSEVARLGSGSACRSLDGGMVRWFKGHDEGGSDCIAKQIAPIDHWEELHVIICVANDNRKKVSSTVGMKRCVDTCGLEWRTFDMLPERLEKIEHFIDKKNWSSFCEVVMIDSNEMHAVCLAARPPIAYMNDTSHEISSFVHQYNDCKEKNNQHHLKVCYTFDAGPNACLFVPLDAMPEFSALLNKSFPKSNSYNSPEEKYWQGISLPSPPDSMMNLDVCDRHSIKYFLHTKVGDGPRILPDCPSSHLLDSDGLPVERPAAQ